eukprot:TRINITY_DN5561_c0_g1_i2.p1 TRINITY_DN5561_c0_g1~~TRINITY_DN5561_c0_g1_i2.p1  ORF type:complete len:761 (+),score=206.74 TRINITY_DN5561_c0_g1_i2:235-2283(+)
MTINVGDRIRVLDKGDGTSAWWRGSLREHEGLFPARYVIPEALTDAVAATVVDQEPSPQLRLLRKLHKLHPLFPLKLPTLVHRVLLYLVTIAVTTAVVSFAIDLFAVTICNLRGAAILRIHGLLAQFVFWALSLYVLAVAAWLLARNINPCSIGSGVPEMRTLISGAEMPQYLTLSTLIGKVLSLSCAIGSGMFVGKQGPMVHIGGMIAYNISLLSPFKFLHASKDLVNQILVTGTAVGISAHFGAPVAGLAFTVEATTTNSSTRSYFLAVVPAVLGALLTRIWYNLCEGRPNLLSPFLDVGVNATPPQRKLQLYTLALCCGLGVICAFLAALFVRLNHTIAMARKRYQQFPLFYYPFYYLLAVATLTAVFTFPGFIGQFMSLSAYQTLRDLFRADLTSPDCLASDWGHIHVCFSLAVLLVVRYLITVMTISTPIPCGLYVTNLVVGAVLGRLAGEIALLLGLDVNPACVSVMCAAAYVSSVTQTFSGALALIDLTGETSILIEVMLTTAVALTVTRLISESIFESMISLRGLPYLLDVQHEDDALSTALAIAQTNLAFVTEVSTIKEIQDVLSHAAPSQTVLPVVSDAERRILIGSVQREALQKPITEDESDGLLEPAARLKMTCERYHAVPDFFTLTQLHHYMVSSRLAHTFVTRNGVLAGWVTRDMLCQAIARQKIVLP